MELFKILGTIAISNAAANKALKETKEEGEKTGSKLATVFSKIGDAALKMGKVVATGMGAISAGIVSATKSALGNYADYEQLVGGVETLFKDSADAVIKNSSIAYQTAGLSANEYMETITSFSASLLQSLGGDTQAAAEKGNQAIIDMSDNANKMGTSMESIQNAYSGFAKQNYTMLDNLKLGYGGTKEEMQRLLDDASKISGFKYDLSSYADIVDAIHVVQTELDITGTTQKEAATTISGSIGMMKSSWTNFLTGMADESQDFDALVDNLIDSISKVADNIIPRIVKATPRVVKGFITLVNKLAPQIPPLLRKLLPTIIKGATQLIQGIVDTLPQLVDALLDSLPMLLNGIVQVMNGIVSALPQLIQMICDALPTVLPLLIDAVVQLAVILMENAPTIIAIIVEALPDVFIAVAAAIVENAPILWEGILKILEPIGNFFIKAFTNAGNGIKKAFTPMINFFKDIFGKINNAMHMVIDPWVQIFKNVVNGIKNAFSPIGNFFKNIWNGIKNTFAPVVNFFTSTFKKAWEGVKNVFSKGGKIFDGIKDGILEGLKVVINGLIKGINKVVSVPFNGLNKALKTLKSIKIAGVKPFKWIDTINVPEIPQLAQGGVLKKGQVGFLEGDGDEAVVPLSKNTEWIDKVAEKINSSGGNNSVVKKLDELITAITSMNIVLDSGAMVGAMTPALDTSLGNLYSAKGRGR